MTIPGTNGALELAPLEEYRVTEEQAKQLNRADAVRARSLQETPEYAEDPTSVLTAAIMLGIGYVVVGLVLTVSNPEENTGPIVGSRGFWCVWGGGTFLAFAAFVVFAVLWTGNRRLVGRWLVQVLALLGSVALGVGLPMCVIYYFGQGKDLLADPTRLEFLGRILQFAFIVVAGLVPALAYFLFDRYRLGTLRNRFYHDIFRLDPTVERLSDVRAKCGKRIDEVFGGEMTTASRIARGTRWPILVCTVVLLLGWMLTLCPVGAVSVNSPSELLRLFAPQQALFIYGFLGAYVYALGAIVKRYSRRDLKARAYTHITVRVLTVFILCWVLGAIVSAEQPASHWYAAAFAIGIVPETFFAFMQETVVSRVLGSAFRSMREKHPLTNLAGIDLYDRTRLLEEGVANVESLAHNDLIDLILETRIPVPQLVDWVDQAILYLHVTPPDEEKGDEANRPLQALGEYGIRTATDLELAYRAAEVRNDADAFLAILPAKAGRGTGGKPGPTRLRVVLDSIGDDEWMANIRNWRTTGLPAAV